MRPLELSTDEFRRLAVEVVELSAQYLASLDMRSTFPTTTGGEAERLFSTQAPEQPFGAAALAGLREFLDHGR